MSLGTNDPCSPMNRVFGRYIAFMVTLTLGISLAAQPVIDWQHDLWGKWSSIVRIASTEQATVVSSWLGKPHPPMVMLRGSMEGHPTKMPG
jgi:hypothetical protein